MINLANSSIANSQLKKCMHYHWLPSTNHWLSHQLTSLTLSRPPMYSMQTWTLSWYRLPSGSLLSWNTKKLCVAHINSFQNVENLVESHFEQCLEAIHNLNRNVIQFSGDELHQSRLLKLQLLKNLSRLQLYNRKIVTAQIRFRRD
jgi:demethoxyubiquinone hydroxylase (CLK1/Coq7/Cat5 family)